MDLVRLGPLCLKGVACRVTGKTRSPNSGLQFLKADGVAEDESVKEKTFAMLNLVSKPQRKFL